MPPGSLEPCARRAEFFRYHTDLGEADTDGDGLPDGLKVQTAVQFGTTAGMVPGGAAGPGTGDGQLAGARSRSSDA